MHTKINGCEADYVDLAAKPGGHLLLRDGTRYTFDMIEIFFYDPPDTSQNLIEVESLAYGAGKWKLSEEPLGEYLNKVQFDAIAQLNRVRAHEGFPAITLGDFTWEVSRSAQLHFGEQTEPEDAVVRRINSEFFPPRYVRRWGLAQLLRERGEQERLRRAVRAAAWFEGSDTPVLLRAFQPMQAAASVEPAPPEYFLSIAEAAKYAGVSGRTITNWKNREWLKVEQQGRKIRIARTELDKCKRRVKP